MGQSFFIWNNTDCRSMGVRLSGPVAIVRPEERVDHTQIQGRSGDLTTLEGENVFNSYIQTATIQVTGWSRVRKVFGWLRGSGYVTFSGEPDRRQKARIIGAVTLNRHSRNTDVWVGEVQFYCQPLKELLISDLVTVAASGDAILNNGDVTAYPVYYVTASATSITLAATGEDGVTRSCTVTGLTSGKSYWIDTEIMEVMNDDETVQYTKNMTGVFPVLTQGENTITFSGLSAVQVDKQERYL